MPSTNHVCLSGIQQIAALGGWNFFRMLSMAMIKAGWKVQASSDGTNKTVSTDPLQNRWCGTFGVLGGITNAGAVGATIAAPVAGRALVTGLVGLSSAAFTTDKGRFLVDKGAGKSYQIEEVLSATSCKIDARSVAVTTGTGINWEIRDPTTDPHPAALNGAACWIVLRGPSIVRIPITTLPDGLLTNEFVRQDATGAAGKLLGVSWDPYTSTGFVTIDPTERGTGADAFGFDSSAITCSVSAASFTPSAAADECITEWCFAKNTTNNQMHFSTCAFFAPSEVAATALSSFAASAGCTATVPPCGGGTGNAKPASVAFLWNSGTTLAYGAIAGNDTGTNYKSALLSCADCIPEAGQPADGTFWLAYCTTVNSPASVKSYKGIGFWRTEGAKWDCHPFLFGFAADSTTVQFLTASVSQNLRVNYWCRKGMVDGGELSAATSGAVAQGVAMQGFGFTGAGFSTSRKGAQLAWPMGCSFSTLESKGNFKGYARWVRYATQSAADGQSHVFSRLQVLRLAPERFFICLGPSGDSQTTLNPYVIGPWLGVQLLQE